MQQKKDSYQPTPAVHSGYRMGTRLCYHLLMSMQANKMDHGQDTEGKRCGEVCLFMDPTYIFSPLKHGNLIHTAYWDQSPKPCPDTVLDGAGQNQAGGAEPGPVQFISVDRAL